MRFFNPVMTRTPMVSQFQRQRRPDASLLFHPGAVTEVPYALGGGALGVLPELSSVSKNNWFFEDRKDGLMKPDMAGDDFPGRYNQAYAISKEVEALKNVQGMESVQILARGIENRLGPLITQAAAAYEWDGVFSRSEARRAQLHAALNDADWALKDYLEQVGPKLAQVKKVVQMEQTSAAATKLYQQKLAESQAATSTYQQQSVELTAGQQLQAAVDKASGLPTWMKVLGGVVLLGGVGYAVSKMKRKG